MSSPRRMFLFLRTFGVDDLVQVMSEMLEIIFRDKAKCDGLASADAAWNAELLRRDPGHDSRNMQVEGIPESDKLFPGTLLISPAIHPERLIIVREEELITLLSPDEPMDIIQGRVNKMTEDLTTGPCSGAAVIQTFPVSDGTELREDRTNDSPKVCHYFTRWTDSCQAETLLVTWSFRVTAEAWERIHVP